MASSNVNTPTSIPSTPPRPPSTLTEKDFIEAFGISALVGYDGNVERAFNLCKDTRNDYHFHLALAKLDTHLYRTRQTHRLMYACITGNAKLFKTLWNAGNENDMVNLIKSEKKPHYYHHYGHHHHFHHNSAKVDENNNLLNYLINNCKSDSKPEDYEDTRQRFEILRLLLQSNIDPNTDPYNYRPLARLLSDDKNQQNLTLAKEFLKYPSRVELYQPRPNYFFSLGMAVENNLPEIVELLCKIPSLPLVESKPRNSSFTPLMEAIKKNNLPIVRILLQYPNRIAINDGEGKHFGTALHIAVYKKYNDIVAELLQCPGIHINATCTYKYSGTPLTVALSRVNTEAARMLLRLHTTIDVNVPNQENQTALHIAADKGYLKIVRTLCTFPNIKIDNLDNHGYAPIHYAVMRERLSMVKTLITKCNVNIVDKTGRSPLYMAVEIQNYDIVRVLAAASATNLNLAEKMTGYSPLHLAITLSSLSDCTIANELLKYSKRLDINIQDRLNGNTCLHLASYRHLLPIIERICEYTTLDPKVTNHKGSNAGALAKQCHNNVMNVLRIHGGEALAFGRFGSKTEETTATSTGTSPVSNISTGTRTTTTEDTPTKTIAKKSEAVTPSTPEKTDTRSGKLGTLFASRTSIGGTSTTTTTTAAPDPTAPTIAATIVTGSTIVIGRFSGKDRTPPLSGRFTSSSTTPPPSSSSSSSTNASPDVSSNK